MSGKLYIVFSSETIDKIKAILSSYFHGKIGSLRIEHDKGGGETNRTLVIMNETLFDAWNIRRDIELKIVPFKVKESLYPQEGYCHDLYIYLPSDIGMAADIIKVHYENILKIFGDFDMIPKDSWTVNIPLKSRLDSGYPKSSCYIKWKKDVTIEAACFVKVFLDGNSLTDGKKTVRLKCFWLKKNKPNIAPLRIEKRIILMSDAKDIEDEKLEEKSEKV